MRNLIKRKIVPLVPPFRRGFAKPLSEESAKERDMAEWNRENRQEFWKEEIRKHKERQKKLKRQPPTKGISGVGKWRPPKQRKQPPLPPK